MYLFIHTFHFKYSFKHIFDKIKNSSRVLDVNVYISAFVEHMSDLKTGGFQQKYEVHNHGFNRHFKR